MSEETMVERVARAIFREGFHADEPESVVAAKWEEWPESRQQCRRRARAAIAAMREPTDDMKFAAIEGCDADLGLVEAREIWQAMIDAALEGQKAD